MLGGRQKPMLGTKLNRAYPLAKGLVGCWLFNEGVGNIAYDTSSYGNHGTLNGMAFPPTVASGWNPSKDGFGLTFDGSNDYINCGNDASLFNASGSIEFWVKQPSDTNELIIAFGDTDALNYFGIRLGADTTSDLTNELITIVGYGTLKNIVGYCTTARTELFDNKRHHIVITGNTEYGIYLDGVSRTVSLGKGNNNGQWTDYPGYDNSRIGCLNFNSGGNRYFYNGSIDSMRIYNRALSAEEIKWLYRAPYCMFEEGELLL